jgi:uncharacterized OB-fold protein
MLNQGSILKDGIPYLVEKSQSMLPFWDGLNSGELKTTICEKCSTIHFPPSPTLCPVCFGLKMNWMSLPLEGIISTWTNVLAPPEGFSGSYILASVIVDKLEKPILGRYQGENPNIGDRVKIAFEKVGDQSVVVFESM